MCNTLTVDAFNLIFQLKFPSFQLAYFLTVNGWSGKMRFYFSFKSLAPTFQFNEMTFNGHR